MSFSPSVRIALLLTFCVMRMGVFAADEPLLTTAAVRALTAKEAGAGRPVKLKGTVTFQWMNGAVFFLQDATGGICVSGPREKPIKGGVKTGIEVEVDGFTQRGRVIPYVTARKKDPLKINLVGNGEMPPATHVAIGQLQQADFQAVPVEVEGVVRSVQIEPLGQNALETLVIHMVDERNRLVVALPGWRGASLPSHLVGASVQVAGIFHSTVLDRQPQMANRLLIGAMKDLKVLQPGQPPFGVPAQSVDSIRDIAANPGISPRVHLQGVVTVPVPNKGFYFEDTSGAVYVAGVPVPVAGDSVEVAGFPGRREGRAVVEDAVWRKIESPVKIAPPLVTSEAAYAGDLDGRLIQIEALLLNVSSAGEGPTLILQGGERTFLARWANPNLRLPSLTENSWLRLTGVCVNSHLPGTREAGPPGPMSFHLVMPGPQAVEIAAGPSWWTFRRIMTVGGGLLALTCAAVVWATTLRRRVAEQTAQIREHLAREAVAEERIRIARELHDSVQQDLLGITMQIKATDRLLLSDPEKARGSLNLASAMVRRSQAETHRAVWDLRESTRDDADLLTALDEIMKGLSTEESTKVGLSSEGERRPLPATVESHVLRLAQEAVTNALKHAQARHIDVVVRFAAERLTLLIRDDGRGFDADHPPSPTSGHFGLFGMRERAIKLEADLRVTSRLGEGTAVQLDVPLPPVASSLEAIRTPSGLRLVPRPSAS